jgi:hypothetical protein
MAVLANPLWCQGGTRKQTKRNEARFRAFVPVLPRRL